MRHPREEADRWLRQAQHDLEVAAKNIDNGYYADACYAAEQAAQKALKGYLYWRGDRLVWKHSVQELIEAVVAYQADVADLSEAGKILDQYYIPTRYPDALAPPAVPFESYTLDQAQEAVALAGKIVDRVTGVIQG